MLFLMVKYYTRKGKLIWSPPNVRYLITIEGEEKMDQRDLWDLLSDLTGAIKAPEDWSEEDDHYLYGVPKRR